MDKLNLNLDDLEVDSFQANPKQEEKRGTVQGNDPCAGPYTDCDGHTCELTRESCLDYITCGCPDTTDCIKTADCRKTAFC